MNPRSRPGTTSLLLLFTLVFLSLRPSPLAERLLGFALAPLRLLAEVTAPLAWLRAPTLHAADAERRAELPREYEERQVLLEHLVRAAEPTGDLRVGRRLIPGAVVGRLPRNRDRLVIRIPPTEAPLIAPGYPVVGGDAYVGRVAEVSARDPGRVEVDLVTGRSFHVGGVLESSGRFESPARMTVGGIDPGARGGELFLAVSNPSDRDMGLGRVVVDELVIGGGTVGEPPRIADLARGFALGELQRIERRYRLIPELDYRDGLFQVTVLAPLEVGAPGAAPPPEELTDEHWRRTRALSHGDPSTWRESLVIDAGQRAGVDPGAALVAGLRLCGRVSRAGPFSSQVALLGDPGLELVAVARVEGLGEPRVLGRLVSAGRAGAAGVAFEWEAVVPLPAELPGIDLERPGFARATLYTGSGQSGLPRGLLLGEAWLPLGGEPGARRQLVVVDGASALDVEELWIRTRPAPAPASREGPR